MVKNLFEEEVLRLFKYDRLKHVVIIALYGGKKSPRYCVHMPMNPEPEVDLQVDHNLTELWHSAFNTNSAVHDGAILVQCDGVLPKIISWSNRLYPPPANIRQKDNKGAGYHSSLDFSMVDNVKCVYLVKEYGVYKFIRGTERVLIEKKPEQVIKR
jgi:hypothetical protein